MSKAHSVVSKYNHSLLKRLFDSIFSLIGLVLMTPLLLLLSVMVVTTSGLPIFFLQKRIGINGKVFKIIKFRTMVKDAEDKKDKYRKRNQADGPVFKIFNDPRFTKMGKILSGLGLDELPQLLNVLWGDMSLVGPRPLPVSEANKLTKSQKLRQLIRPGITSLWVVNGSHTLSFRKWMSLDIWYVKNASLSLDLQIIIQTVLMILG